jgi:hypothetical protein
MSYRSKAALLKKATLLKKAAFKKIVGRTVIRRTVSMGAVGAFGEKAVEAELLRRGWMTSNVNASIKNAEAFDLFAKKGTRFVSIRVKTTSMRIFQFGFGKHEIVLDNIDPTDFTVLVSMGAHCERSGDQFYVVPTSVLRQQIQEHRDIYMSSPTRSGKRRVDIGMWALHLDEMPSDKGRYSHGYEERWKKYHNKWCVLDGVAV